MLCISQNPDSVDYYISDAGNNQFYTYSYVWNESTPWFSEFGNIIVQSAYGGLKRLY